MSEPKSVLFVNPNVEDYLADGVFHGLRTILGPNAVDFPKAEYLYSSASEKTLGRLRGHGFTLYGLLDDIDIDRDHCLARALAGEFDLVIFGDIWRTFGMFTEWAPQLQKHGIAMSVLDGADRVEPYPYAGYWWRVPGWWFLPRATKRTKYFKREITPWTRWFGSYLTLPPPINSFRLKGLKPLAFSIPAEQIVPEPPPKKKDFASHVVDPEFAELLGVDTSYCFSNEEDYFSDLRSSRFGVTTKRAGWDALRHYEIAAAGTVPCFRDLDRKPEDCAPYGLIPGVNCLSYASAPDLVSQVESLDEATYRELQAGAIAWAWANTTEKRAAQVLEESFETRG